MISSRLTCQVNLTRKALHNLHPDWSNELIRQAANVACQVCATCGRNPIVSESVRVCAKCGILARKRSRTRLNCFPHVLSGKGRAPAIKGEKLFQYNA